MFSFNIDIFLIYIPIIRFLFGLWSITAINKCAHGNDGNEDGECDDFEVVTIFHGLIYVFQVFIGTGDLSGTGQGIYVLIHCTSHINFQN